MVTNFAPEISEEELEMMYQEDLERAQGQNPAWQSLKEAGKELKNRMRLEFHALMDQMIAEFYRMEIKREERLDDMLAKGGC